MKSYTILKAVSSMAALSKSKSNASAPSRDSEYGSCCVPLFHSKFHAAGPNPISKSYKNRGRRQPGFRFKSVHFLQKKNGASGNWAVALFACRLRCKRGC
nr:hypothetical protein [Mucilaginibacter sp. E4BP6]